MTFHLCTGAVTLWQSHDLKMVGVGVRERVVFLVS